MTKDKVVIKQDDSIVTVKFIRDGKTLDSFLGTLQLIKLQVLRNYCRRMLKEHNFKYIRVHTLCNDKVVKKVLKQINKSGIEIIQLKNKQYIREDNLNGQDN